MSLSLLPTELTVHIANFILPSKLSRDEVKSSGKNMLNLSLVNTKLQEICKSKLSDLKRIYELLNKYSQYQDIYENPRDWRRREFDPKGNPQLLDALFTGCNLSYAKSTFDTYNEQIENDIREIVELTPQSMNCILGEMRCREEITPLFAACVNTNIPIHIIEFLLKNKADPNATIKCSNQPISMLDDLEEKAGRINSNERLSQIKELFLKYGANV